MGLTIYFEGAIYGQENMRTLADRTTHAAGRMLEGYATVATRLVPRDAVIAVGTFDFRAGRINLTGPGSERAVAAWLGTLRLEPSELAQTAKHAPSPADMAHLVPDIPVTVNRSLGEALIERAGIGRDGEGSWLAADGRRTSTISEALLWALARIASED
jgi:hypothetical protein